MDLNLQLTRQTKILIGVLGLVLIVAVVVQWGPGLYAVINNQDMEAKRKNLKTSKDLVAASEILKPIESDLLQKAGLTKDDENKHIFEDSFPETVIREKIDAIVKKAGIPPNYQMNMEAVPGKKSEKASPQARQNLVVYLYQKKLETERNTINAEIEAQIQAENEAQEQAEMEAENETMDMLMNAWLNETDEEGQKDLDPVDVEDNEEKPKEEKEDNEYHNDEAKGDQNDIDEKADEKTEHKGDEEITDEHNADKEIADEHKGDEEITDEHKGDEETEETETDPENPDQVDKENDTDSSEESQKDENDQPDSENVTEPTQQELVEKGSVPKWEFASFPDSIPKYMQVELIELMLSMAEQHLVGAEKTLFENQYYKTQKPGTTGFLGIGGKKTITEISFRPNSQIITKFRQLIDTHDEKLDEKKLTTELLEYLEKIQAQIAELSEKLLMAPTSYTPESYTVKIKFKAEMDKMVNFNRLIETSSKWLRIRDLKISVDRKENKINADVLMIARVYQ